MADTPEPAAAVLDLPAAAANGRDLDALAGWFASGDRNQIPAHPALAGQVARNSEQIFIFVPGLTATALGSARDACVTGPRRQMTGARRDGTAVPMAGVIIFGSRDVALPGLVVALHE